MNRQAWCSAADINKQHIIQPVGSLQHQSRLGGCTCSKESDLLQTESASWEYGLIAYPHPVIGPETAAGVYIRSGCKTINYSLITANLQMALYRLIAIDVQINLHCFVSIHMEVLLYSLVTGNKHVVKSRHGYHPFHLYYYIVCSL